MALKKKRRIQFLRDYLLRFSELQLFLSAMSLPFLIAWGLPLSLWSPIGNLIFGPILTLFLLFSSLIFFTELIGIPNAFICWILEQLTQVWLFILNSGSQYGMISAMSPSLIFLGIIPLGALTIILFYRRSNQWQRITGMLMYLIIVWFLLTLYRLDLSLTQDIACHTGNVPFIHHNGVTILIDTGVIARRPSAVSWVTYTCIPELIRQTGKQSIDYLILLQPNIRTFEALEAFCSAIPIKKIYLPAWKGELTYKTWKIFNQCKKLCATKGIAIHYIAKHPILITVSVDATVEIVPHEQHIIYQKAYFPACSVRVNIDKKLSTFYAAKLKGLIA